VINFSIKSAIGVNHMNLSNKLNKIKPQVKSSPWVGYEHSKGYAVMILPFSSGHMLGLRVFPENDFAPYKSVWHLSPQDDWSIYNDGPSFSTTCPRWWGSALKRAELSHISLNWVEDNSLEVVLQDPPLKWFMEMTAPPFLQILNALSTSLPLWTWKKSAFLRIREWIAKYVFDMGDLRFSFMTPEGQNAIIMPEQIFFIKTSEAELEGVDLGKPVSLEKNPDIGGVPLPTRPSFIVGQAHGTIVDPDEYRQTRESITKGNYG
jgi:hypothetical protein